MEKQTTNQCGREGITQLGSGASRRQTDVPILPMETHWRRQQACDVSAGFCGVSEEKASPAELQFVGRVFGLTTAVQRRAMPFHSMLLCPTFCAKLFAQPLCSITARSALLLSCWVCGRSGRGAPSRMHCLVL